MMRIFLIALACAVAAPFVLVGGAFLWMLPPMMVGVLLNIMKAEGVDPGYQFVIGMLAIPMAYIFVIVMVGGIIGKLWTLVFGEDENEPERPS